MDREGLLRKYSRMLERYGFSETYVYGLRSSFDMISRKRDRIMILKFVENIDSLSSKEAETLKKLDDFFGADTFVLFKNYKGWKAEKDMMFTRHGVNCLSYSTFEDTLNGARVARAQRFINKKYRINANELRRLRKMQNLSAKGLSQATKISRDAIYRYEKGGFAKEQSLDKLQNFFKANLEERMGEQKPEYNYKYQRMNDALDMNFLETGASPFQILGKRHFRYEIGGDADSRTMKKVASFYKRFSEVIHEDYPFFVTYKEKAPGNFEGIPVISNRELKRIRDERELLDIIESRSRN